MKLKHLSEDFFVREVPLRDPSGKGGYTWFWLRKKNYTTQKAVELVAQKIRVSPTEIGFAGLKDRQAITEQVCSVKRQAEQLANIQLQDISITPIGQDEEQVYVGMLKGNSFALTIRNLTGMPVLKERFINSFGGQRFSKNNHLIGKAIVKGDWKTAVELVVQSKAIPERKVDEYLALHPHDYVTAIIKLPFKQLKLYVHAYQSWLWNKMAEKIAGSLKPEARSEESSFTGSSFKPTASGPEELPVIGFETEPDEAVEKVLKEEGITTRSFIIPAIKNLSAGGGMRRVYCEAKNLQIGKLEDDECFPGKKKVKVEFFLPKGCYATVFLGQIG